MSGLKVGPVYRDPRGKNDEHVFTVWKGALIKHKRESTRERAETLRARFVKEAGAR